MDEYPSKRVVGAVGFNRKGSSIAVRGNQESRSIQHCNRLGCSTSHSSLRGTQNGNPEKPKLSRPAFLSTSSRATVGSSSRTTSNLNDHGKSSCARRNKSSLQRVTVESSSRQGQKEYLQSSIKQEDIIKLDIDPSSAAVQTIHPEAEAVESSDVQGFITNAEEASGSSSGNQKPTRKTESSNHSSSSSVRRPVVPRNTSHSAKPSRKQVDDERKYGLRNLSCSSISNVLPSGCSSSGHYNKRMDTFRKRYSDGENSAARGKRSTVSSNRGHPGPSSNGRSGISLLERPLSQPASRRTRDQLTSRDGVLSVRTQRFSNGDNRMRILEHVDANSYLLPEPLMIPSLTQAQVSIGEAATASLSLSLPDYVAPICRSSSGQSGPRSGTTTRCRLISNSEDTNSRISHDTRIDRESFRSLNMEGIEEVLLALERIEQDEELTYEQLMVLQSNLFVGGIGFHDQHRDWRLDIDNMSYEELLALEEKMGTVSTALSEEELFKCLKRGVYTPISELGATCRDDDDDDDVKCSICQEEFMAGDELGRLHCDHRYHMSCIHQWLRQKNWCPICKSSACPC